MERLSSAAATLATGFLPAAVPARVVEPRLPLPKAVLCDLDGTLIDSMPVLADLATEVLVEVFGLPRALGREMYLATCGLPFIRQLDHICPGDPRNPQASDLFEGRKPARCNQVRMPADTRRALHSLRERGVRIAISSNNGISNVEAFAAASGFPFDLVLGYGGGSGKGRPHMEAAMSTFGLRKSDLLFVGDSLHDGEIAAQEGVPFVGVLSTFSRERFALRFPGVPVVQRFADLTDLFPA